MGDHGKSMDGCKMRGDIAYLHGFYRYRGNIDVYAFYVDSRKLPDKTLSQDKRLISDVRLVNAWCDKYDYPPVGPPRLD